MRDLAARGRMRFARCTPPAIVTPRACEQRCEPGPGRQRGVGRRDGVVRLVEPAVDGERAQRSDVAFLGVHGLPAGQEPQRLVHVIVDE